VACDQRKQECVYPEQQKKRGPKPRSALNGANTTASGLIVAPCSSGSSVVASNSVLSAVDFGSNQMVGITSGNSNLGKGKRRRLNGEDGVVSPVMTSMENYKLNEVVSGERELDVQRIGLCQCLQEIMQLIQRHPHAHPFLQPVSLSDAPDYYEIIHQPIDFGTMAKKVNTFQYFSLTGFSADLNLLVDNCRKYNEGTCSAYLIDWAVELQTAILEELQKRTDLFWYQTQQPISPSDQIENFRSMNHELDISDIYEIDVRFPQLFTTTPLESWPIMDGYDFLDNCLSSPYSELIEFHNPVYGEDQKFL